MKPDETDSDYQFVGVYQPGMHAGGATVPPAAV